MDGTEQTRIARARAMVELLRGSRAGVDLRLPGDVVRRLIPARSSAIRSVDLLPPRRVRLGVALGPLTRSVELDLLDEIHYRPDAWIPVGDLSGAVGTLLRVVRVLPVKRELTSLLDVRRGPGGVHRLHVDAGALLAGTAFAEVFPDDAELNVSEIDFSAGEVTARLYAAI